MIISGKLTGHENRKIAIVVSRFNQLVTDRLVQGAKEGLMMHGVKDENITIIWVPGAFEIPVVTKKVADSEKFDGIVTLGAVIKGETDHYDLVINAVGNGVAQVSLASNIPTVFGVVTTDTLEQAEHRAGGKAGNKGNEVAVSLLEIISLADQLN